MLYIKFIDFLYSIFWIEITSSHAYFKSSISVISKKFGYEFDDDGYHLSIYSNYELETISDLENTIDEVLNIYKELYIRAGSIAHKAILTILHMKS